MKVNVDITKNCKLVAQGVDEKKKVYMEFYRLLHPCEVDVESLSNELNNILNPCETIYDGKTVYVEFVIYEDGNSGFYISENLDNEFVFDLPKDGLYAYYKIKIYKKEYIETLFKKTEEMGYKDIPDFIHKMDAHFSTCTTPYDAIVFMCYESPNEFCHRHLLRRLLNNVYKIGGFINEMETETVFVPLKL